MPLKSIGIKGIFLKKSLATGLKKAKNYKISPIGAGLFAGSVLAKGHISKDLYRAGQVYQVTEISLEILNVIRKAYQSEVFYKSTWKIKAKILAKRIVRNKIIQTTVTETVLYRIIYNILKRNQNRQGNEKLAKDIEKELINNEISQSN